MRHAQPAMMRDVMIKEKGHVTPNQNKRHLVLSQPCHSRPVHKLDTGPDAPERPQLPDFVRDLLDCALSRLEKAHVISSTGIVLCRTLARTRWSYNHVIAR